jgi:hypothetical protein
MVMAYVAIKTLMMMLMDGMMMSRRLVIPHPLTVLTSQPIQMVTLFVTLLTSVMVMMQVETLMVTVPVMTLIPMMMRMG